MWSWIYWWRTINVDCLSLHVHFWVNKPINFKDCLAVGLVCFGIVFYRFSAFWLRSKCSICSYQLNIWYAPYMGASILNWFLNLGEVSGACSAFATGWPGIAVPPGSAHSPLGDNEIQWQYNKHWSQKTVHVTVFLNNRPEHEIHFNLKSWNLFEMAWKFQLCIQCVSMDLVNRPCISQIRKRTRTRAPVRQNHQLHCILSPFLTGRMFVRPNILRTLRRTMIRFLIELLVRRIWFGQSKLCFILNWLVMRCKLRPELAADAQQTAWLKM